jgi:hypothetical protein
MCDSTQPRPGLFEKFTGWWFILVGWFLWELANNSMDLPRTLTVLT